MPVETITGRLDKSFGDDENWVDFSLDRSASFALISRWTVLEGCEAVGCGIEGRANASSARASVTLSLMSFGIFVTVSELTSNANLLPESWRMENPSRGGNGLATSSKPWVGARGDLPSRASNGSLAILSIGVVLCTVVLCSGSVLLGLPRLIGMISGKTSSSLATGT